MLSFWPMVTILALCAPPGVQPGGGSSVGYELLHCIAALERPQQQAWLRRMEARADRAIELILPPEAAAKEKARIHATLRQKAIPWLTVLALVREIEAREKAAIERLASRFHTRAGETSAQDRSDAALRGEAWNRVLGAWQQAGSPFEQQDRLIHWLVSASRGGTPGASASLPEQPRFAPDPSTFRPLVGQGSSGKLWPGLLPDSTFVPVRPPRLPVSLPEHKRRKAAPIGREGRGAVAARFPRFGPLRPPVVARRESVRQGPDGRPVAATRPVASFACRPAGPSADRPAPLELPTSPPPQGITDAAAVSAGRPAQAATFEVPPQERPVRRPPPIKPPDVPASEPPGEPPDETARQPQPPKIPPVRVNLDELSARIAGNNLALRGLEADLAEPRQWDAGQLGPLVDKLKILVMRKKDLALIRGLLPAVQQAKVGRLESPQSAISRLGARIFEARTQAESPGFPGSEARRRAELKHLDELSRQLAETASGQ